MHENQSRVVRPRHRHARGLGPGLLGLGVMPVPATPSAAAASAPISVRSSDVCALSRGPTGVPTGWQLPEPGNLTAE